MKITDLKKTIKENFTKGSFINDCIFNSFHQDLLSHTKMLVRKAKDFADFKKLYFADPLTRYSDGAAALISCFPSERWYAIRAAFGENCRKTYTDVGALQVCAPGFTFFIPNGYGDGEFRYVVLDKEPEYVNLFCRQNHSAFEVKEPNTVSIEGEYLSTGLYFAQSFDGLVLIYRARG